MCDLITDMMIFDLDLSLYIMIVFSRFASITINLGPTFLSGALAANSESYLNKPSCPLIQGPFRHYVLNVLWIFINVLCVLLTMYHLYKLYKDLSRSNLEAVRVASLVTTMISVNQTPTSFDQRILGQGGMSGLTNTTSIHTSDSNNQMLHQNNISRNNQGKLSQKQFDTFSYLGIKCNR